MIGVLYRKKSPHWGEYQFLSRLKSQVSLARYYERFRDSASQLRMRSTSNVTMLGGDLVQYTTEGDGLACAGLMGGYGTMDTKSRSKMTNLRSKSETDAWGVGAYAGWKANKDGQTELYVDG